jgi:hypothetical protein
MATDRQQETSLVGVFAGISKRDLDHIIEKISQLKPPLFVE